MAAARLIAVGGLVIDAYVHLDLASIYSEAALALLAAEAAASAASLAGLVLLLIRSGLRSAGGGTGPPWSS